MNQRQFWKVIIIGEAIAIAALLYAQHLFNFSADTDQKSREPNTGIVEEYARQERESLQTATAPAVTTPAVSNAATRPTTLPSAGP